MVGSPRRLMRTLVLCIGVIAALGVFAGSAMAWNTDYPLGTCFSTANGLNQCKLGYTYNLTFNRGSSPYFSDGVCVYSITSAGNIRGGGAVPCTSSTYTIYECFSYATPASEARTYAYVTDKVLTGHADDSPNHTGCF